MNQPILTRTLRRHERSAYTRHLLQLDAEDRRLRFGLPCDDARIHEYVAGIDFERDAVLCVFDDELALVGAAHVARGSGSAEVGVSVLKAHRGRGIGSALMERSRLHARNRGDAELYTFCAADNAAMMRLARKLDMQTSVARGEADARAALPPPDPASHAAELISERVGAADYALKQQLAQARKIASAWRPFQAA
ncbi:MAG: N-acetyltransferase family protein [Burkholderiales bacterium]